MANYITFEQAKWFKEKGFTQECDFYYRDWYGEIQFRIGSEFSNSPEDDSENEKLYLAPEQHKVVEWLLDKHGIHIEILLEENSPWTKFYYRAMKIGQYFSLSHDSVYFNSPQEAYSAAFDYIKNNNLIQ